MDNNLINPEPNNSKVLNVLEELEPRQKLFLMLLLEGKKVVEAYQEAGYDGKEKASAYQLKSRLNKQLEQLAIAKNMSKGDLLTQVSNLYELPVVDKQGQAITGITIQTKLRLLSLHNRILDNMTTSRPNITAITINRAQDTDVSIKDDGVNGQVIDISDIKSMDKEQL